MLKKFIDSYNQLSDSIILELLFKGSLNKIEDREIEATIYCANILSSDFKYEIVKIKFSKIVSFTFFENEEFANFVLKDVLIKEDKNYIIFDFDPVDHFDYLEENVNSNFKVNCEKIEYQVISKC